MCSLFLSVNITISRFVLTLPSVGEIEECAAVHLQLLEDAGKPVANLQARSGLE